MLTKDRLQAVVGTCLGQQWSSLQQEWPAGFDFFQRTGKSALLAWVSFPEGALSLRAARAFADHEIDRAWLSLPVRIRVPRDDISIVKPAAVGVADSLDLAPDLADASGPWVCLAIVDEDPGVRFRAACTRDVPPAPR
jgi:hypothetical protein